MGEFIAEIVAKIKLGEITNASQLQSAIQQAINSKKYSVKIDATNIDVSGVTQKLETALKNAKIPLGNLGFKEIETALKGAVTEAQRLSKEAKNISDAFSGSKISTSKLSAEMSTFMTKNKSATKEMKANVSKLQAELSKLGTTNVDENAFYRIQSEFQAIKTEASDMAKKVSSSFASLREVGSLSGKMDGFLNTSNATQDVIDKIKVLKAELSNVTVDNSMSVQRLKAIETEFAALKKEANETSVVLNKINAGLNPADGANSFSSKITALEESMRKAKVAEEDIISTTSALKEALAGMANATSVDTKVAQYEKFGAELDIAKRKATNLKNELKQIASPDKQFSLSSNIQTWLKNNTKAARECKTELKGFIAELNTGNLTGERVNEITTAFKKLQAEQAAAGNTGTRYMDVLINKAKTLSAYFSVVTVITKTIQVLKTGINEVVSLDTALVDLQKTTSMSSIQLEQFYLDANNVAKQMGVTTEEIINQASAWSRLGYSSAEAATQMAKLSSQFAEISPGMDVDTATDGLVSTMRAYGIEVEDVSRKIMDNINIVGNTAGTSNSEIVDMLTRSSAAMAAANNSLEETIALETAAVEITRNAESTGTAFKTIAMRIRGESRLLPPYTVMCLLCA